MILFINVTEVQNGINWIQQLLFLCSLSSVLIDVYSKHLQGPNIFPTGPILQSDPPSWKYDMVGEILPWLSHNPKKERKLVT